jgi:hypothetical protein
MPIELAQVWAYRFQAAPLRGKPTSPEMEDSPRYWRVTRTVGVETPLGHWKEWVDLVNAFGQGEWDLWRYDLTNEWVEGDPEDVPSSEGMLLYFKRRT